MIDESTKPSKYRVAYAGDGIVHDGGLIVERFEVHARGQGRLQLRNLFVDFVGHIQGIAVRLPIHAEQHRRLSIRGHNGVNRRFRWGDRWRRPRCELARPLRTP